MDIENKIKELEQKIDDNMDKIINNMNKLHNHEEKINTNSKKIQKNSYALDILTHFKNESKRLFIALIVVLCMWFATIGYLVYILNDIGTTETTQEITDVETIENSNITNGDNYGEN